MLQIAVTLESIYDLFDDLSKCGKVASATIVKPGPTSANQDATEMSSQNGFSTKNLSLRKRLESQKVAQRASRKVATWVAQFRNKGRAK